MTKTLLTLVMLFLSAFSIAMAEPALKREDPIERDVRRISERLRCPVCQSENLYDSKAALAREMRGIIREQLSEGRSEDEIVNFFVGRYGTFVLQQPPKAGLSLLLWIIPFVLAIAALVALTVHLRRHQRAGEREGAIDGVEGRPS